MSTPTATSQDDATVYEDLKGFLQSTRIDLRLEATKAVLQVVASDRKEAAKMVQHGIILPLLRTVSDTTSTECASNALQSILYLSSSVEEVTNQCVEELMEARAVPRLVELVLSSSTQKSTNNDESNNNNTLVNYALAILANLTRTEHGAVELVGKTLPDEAVKEISDADKQPKTRPTMELLLDRFLNRELLSDDMPDYESLHPAKWDTLSQDPYQHFAAILMNATQTELGRKFVLRIPQQSDDDKNAPPQKSIFETLLPQLQNRNPIRRRGISGMIRNCCCRGEGGGDSAWWMLNVVKLTSHLLYPLAGPEELDMDEKRGMDPDLWLAGPDKVREIDGPTRLHLVESILLLCATGGRKSRETLRLARTYVILKYADMVEELESVSERINECVQYLRRDEEGTAEGSSDRMVEEATMKNVKNQLKLLSLPAAEVHGLDAGADYDDVD